MSGDGSEVEKGVCGIWILHVEDILSDGNLLTCSEDVHVIVPPKKSNRYHQYQSQG